MRINRYFTALGICSRREADRHVADGRVRINDRTAVPGNQVGENDRVYLDGKEIRSQVSRPIVLAFNKPVGIESTSDPRVKENIIDAVNFDERLFHIGRLDKMSEGLILLTNIGDLVNATLRKAHRREKEYHVWLNGEIADADLNRLARGIELDDGVTLPCGVERLGPNKIAMTLIEGRNRQIRRMIEAIGMKVSRLMRVRFMNVRLGVLRFGETREVLGPELETLLRLAKIQIKS